MNKITIRMLSFGLTMIILLLGAVFGEEFLLFLILALMILILALMFVFKGVNDK